VIPDDYHDFFVAAVGAAGALIGLLFVAISVSPSREADKHRMRFEVEASSALIAFSHALALSLLALKPGINIGYPAVILAGLELAYAAATVRIIFTGTGQLRPSYAIPLGLTVIAGFDLWAGIALIAHSHRPDAVGVLSYIVLTSLIFGISRSWQLVGLRDIGLSRSLRVLLGFGERDE
jgi:hypothetical protein